jgi:hypothetical protein
MLQSRTKELGTLVAKMLVHQAQKIQWEWHEVTGV